MSRQHNPGRKKPLVLLQANVGKGAAAHEIALNTAYDEGIDIVLIQEPYVFDYNRRISKKHPAFECFSPLDDWSAARPRVLTYMRKGAGIRAEQSRPAADLAALSDLLFLSIMSPSSPALLIVNAYNAPRGCRGHGAAVQALSTLPQTSFPSHTLLAGDFNLHHERWQPSYKGTDTAAAEPFIEWLDQMSFTLASDPDVPTHRRGNVLDLVFTTSRLTAAGAAASVDQDFATSADHHPLVTSIPWDLSAQPTARRLRFDTLNSDRFRDLLSANLASVPPSAATSTEELDVQAQALIDAVQNAYIGAAKRALGKGTGQPWWNEDCKQAAATFRRAHRLDPFDADTVAAQRELRRVTRCAKRAFWRNRIDKVSKSKEVFDMTKWHRSTGAFRMPPLRDPLNPAAPPASSLEEKGEVLIKNLLTNAAEVGDIPPDTPTVPRAALPFPEITDIEAENAVLRAANTAPGADEVTTAVLLKAWALIKNLVLRVYRGCLHLGHHPAAFRTAALIFLNKPNKADRSAPRSYRPITLLSVLGKGLERLIAKRLSWQAIEHGVLAKQQFGALPLRSSVDLTTCLTHDVESALNRGLTASLLTLDVKGAFDSVLPGRLAHRLRSQGWPDNVVNWASSFSTNRKVRVCLNGTTGPPMDIFCGLPQGSPVSPILFMLYISPLLRLGRPKTRFGYADDVALLATSPSLKANCESLSKSLSEALDWGASEGVTFDPLKSELIHFTRKRPGPQPPPFVQAGDHKVVVNTEKPTLRWLGVLFDRTLSFKWHAKSLAAKAYKISQALRSFSNTVRGVPPHLMRQAVVACVLPVAYFAAETWWPGRIRPHQAWPATPYLESRGQPPRLPK